MSIEQIVEVLRYFLISVVIMSWAVLFKHSKLMDKVGYSLMAAVILFVIITQ